MKIFLFFFFFSFFFFFFLEGNKNCRVGTKNRVGRVSGNTGIFRPYYGFEAINIEDSSLNVLSGLVVGLLDVIAAYIFVPVCSKYLRMRNFSVFSICSHYF